MEFKDLVGIPIRFFGVDNCRFKIGAYVFEAIEDESDGWRSYLGSIEVAKDPSDIFFKDQLAIVVIEDVETGNSSGYRFVDAHGGHEWLWIGTNNTDDYYPSFVFHYSPKPNTEMG